MSEPRIIPVRNAAAVTPSDTVDLVNPARALYVGATGNVKVLTQGGDTVTFVGCPAGLFIPVMVRRVFATLTTATSILALYDKG